eukprot:m.36521 g.36521  ORF g.36521 m.36521 type:complete len:535 (-) comp16016_c0_seq1:60-1664(-)
MADMEIVVTTKVQKSGILLKKPFGHSSSKWSRRFFVLKDGFLLYYPEKEAKAFQQTGNFNVHPKGVIPLGGCCVDEVRDPSQPFALQITHSDFGRGQVWLGAESQSSLKDWIHWIYESSRVTYKNACLGDTLVASLKAKGSELEKQKEATLEQLKKEGEALKIERNNVENMTEEVQKLLDEKKRAQALADKLSEEQDERIKQLQKTNTAIETMARKKAELEEKANELASKLKAASHESNLTMQQLQDRDREAQNLAQEKELLAAATAQLAENLANMEGKAQKLESEKQQAEIKLSAAEQSAREFQDEIQEVTKVAQSLESEVATSVAEKEKAQREKAKERRERLKVERKLKLAEDALARLEKALRDSGVKIDIDIEADVSSLKKFFEEALEEVAWEATKTDTMREALTATATAKKDITDEQISSQMPPKPQVKPTGPKKAVLPPAKAAAPPPAAKPKPKAPPPVSTKKPVTAPPVVRAKKPVATPASTEEAPPPRPPKPSQETPAPAPKPRPRPKPAARQVAPPVDDPYASDSD